MDYTFDELSSWDVFFYYGQNDLDLELSSDLMLLAIQPDRSLYYDRKESGGIAGDENHPNSLNMQVNIRFNIASAVAWKNRIIMRGIDGYPERRVAISQNSVSFQRDNSGNLDVSILFIPYYNYTKYKVINAPMAGVK